MDLPMFTIHPHKDTRNLCVTFGADAPSELLSYLEPRVFTDIAKDTPATPEMAHNIAARLNFWMIHLVIKDCLWFCPEHGWQFQSPPPN